MEKQSKKHEKLKKPHMSFVSHQFVKEILSTADLMQGSSRKLPLRRTSHHADTDQHMIPLHWQTVYNELPVQDKEK